ncbi:hypothetical protein BDR22DRAFT_827186 [Usnea florida]
MFTAEDPDEPLLPSRYRDKSSLLSSLQILSIYLVPENDKYRAADGELTLKEATYEYRLRFLVDGEENEENEAQDRLLQDQEDEAGPAATEPPEDASKDRSEKEVDAVGSGFLCVVQDAMKNAVQGDDVDKNVILAHNLDTFINLVVEKCF